MKTIACGVALVALLAGPSLAQDSRPSPEEAIRATLTKMHLAGVLADAEMYFSRLDERAVLLGTDATERWSRDELRAVLTEYFERGEGISSVPFAQEVFLADSGRWGWFDERLRSKWGELRGTGVVRLDGDAWKVVHYHTAFPVPNDHIKTLVKQIGATPADAIEEDGEVEGARDEVAAVLRSFARAAAEANHDAYFAHFAPEAVFFGTDATERWTLQEFEDYAAPHFAKGKGWSILPSKQHVEVSDDGDFAWFDEMLNSTSYGEMRGSGVLVRRDGQWKIAQYNLVLTVPNEFIPALMEMTGGEVK